MAKEVKKTAEVLPKTTMAENMKLYDKFLVHVHRKTSKKGKETIGITTGVSVGKLLRANIKCSEESAAMINKTQDHQNNTSEGVPVITYMFPAGQVKTGMELDAKDLKVKDISDKEEDTEDDTIAELSITVPEKTNEA